MCKTKTKKIKEKEVTPGISQAALLLYFEREIMSDILVDAFINVIVPMLFMYLLGFYHGYEFCKEK